MRAVRVFGVLVVFFLALAAGLFGSVRAGWWNPNFETLVQKYAGPPSKFAAVEGANLHYRDEGAGRVVVLLHGSGASLHEWDLVVPRLTQKYRVIRLDWPPYGLSVDSTDSYSSPRAADLLAALVDKLRIRKFVLVATSNGGNVALAYAANHQDRLDAMAFSMLPIQKLTPNPSPSLRVRFMTWFFPTYLPDYRPKWFFKTIFEETTPPGFQITENELDSVYEQNNLPGAAARQAGYLAANRKVFLTGDAGAAAETIKVPVLLQWCDLDTVIFPKERGDQAKARFGHAPVTLIHYPDFGHFPMFEDPERYTRDLSAFIDNLPPDPS